MSLVPRIDYQQARTLPLAVLSLLLPIPTEHLEYLTSNRNK